MKNRMVMGLTVVIATGRNHFTGKKKKRALRLIKSMFGNHSALLQPLISLDFSRSEPR